MLKPINIINIPDFKDSSGRWVKSYSEILDNKRIFYTTRAARLWNAIKKRTKVDGAVHKTTERYRGTENHFKGFQEFATWCQDQFGYLNKETNGNFWSLDKDFIDKDRNCYSEDTCLFMPAKVNCVIGSSVKSRGDNPIGVHFCSKRKLFVSQITVDGRIKLLGRFTNKQKAHKAWQEAKLITLLELSNDASLGYKIQGVLKRIADGIREDLLNGKESIFN